MTSQQPSHEWQSARTVLASEQLDEILQTRLVQIALDTNQSGASTIRAIELLMTLGRSEWEDPLEDIPTEYLEYVNRRVTEYIERARDESGL